MLLKNRNHFATKSSAILWSCMLALCLFSCNQPQTTQQTNQPSNALLDSAYAQCSVWLMANNSAAVSPYLDSLFSQFSTVSDAQLLNKYHFLANMHLYNTKNLLAAKSYLDSSKVLLKSSPASKKEYLRYYFLKSNYHLELQEFDLAVSALFQGKGIIEELGLKCEGGRFANSLGYLLYKQGRYEEALAAFKWRNELTLNCREANVAEPIFELQLDQNEIGLCYEQMGKFDSALFHYSQCIALILDFQKTNAAEATKLDRSLGVVYGNKGSTFAKMHQYDSAIFYLQKGIEINFRPDREPVDAAFCKIKLAHCYLELNELQNCEAIIQELEIFLTEKPNLVVAQRLANLQKDYYLQTKNFEKAYAFGLLQQTLKDSLNAFQPGKSNFYDYKIAFDNLKKEVELLSLQNTNARKNLYIVLISAALLVSMSIGLATLTKRKRELKFTEKLKEVNIAITQKNQELLLSLKNLEQSYNDNARIMKILAHDLRTPMAGIISTIQLLQYENISKQEQNELLQLIEKSSENALHFIKDILQLNALDQPSDYVKQDLSKILLSCLQLLKHEADKKAQQLEIRLLSIYVPVNQQKIWRVFNNLINNAIKFSAAGQTIYIEMEELPDAVVITVRDKGIGIAESRTSSLFDMFAVTGNQGTAGEKSFGLGLAITKQIVVAHQGDIWLESTEHIGSTFYVKLPKNRRS